MTPYLRTDETEETISALEMLAETIPALEGDVYRWKWAIIFLHNALQGFMVLALRGTNGLRTMSNKVARKRLAAYREGGTYSQGRMDSFMGLYEKIKGDEMLFYYSSKKFEPTSAHDGAVRHLNDLRNKFVHFHPKTLSLEVSGLPNMCLRCLEVMEFLGWESGNVVTWEKEQSERGMTALLKTRDALHDLERAYEKDADGRSFSRG